MTKKKTIVLGVAGSIAAYKAGDIVRRLKDEGYAVLVVMTKEAEKFITPLTLQSLSAAPVYRDMFEGQNGDWQMSHIVLGKEADALLIAPATANIIGKIACGLADDLLSCAAMAARAPVLIAPAMNDEMYANRVVQENIAKLKKLGVVFVDPVEGDLACGTVGIGHLAEVADIVKAVKKAIS